LLTADLVRCRRKGDELKLQPLDGKARAEAEEVAESLLAIAAAHVGQRRDAFDEACDVVVGSARDRRLASGVLKLVEDRCEFEADPAVPPEELRREVFLRATTLRRAVDDGEFDRGVVLAEVAEARGISVDDVERGLYADLRGAHDLAQAQAVLLRAVRLKVEVHCASTGAYRTLFRKLKFLRLLHTIQPRDEGGYIIEIDGPFSLFESVTKYGLQLALALPAIRECDRWTLEAKLQWGPQKTPLVFKAEGKKVLGEREVVRLPDDVEALLRGLEQLDTPWKAAPAEIIVDLPGIGYCVPDLELVHGETGECVYLEVLGYWSRAAVWKRVELVQQGLDQRIVFAVGKHLRVSEEAIDDDAPGALYVYKRTMAPKAVIERVEAVTQVRVEPRGKGTPAKAEPAAKAAKAEPPAKAAPAAKAAKAAPPAQPELPGTAPAKPKRAKAKPA
jgi:predicted nuclease of restriction endonuclease-like RecB superfamily